jgi:arsenite transporter
MSDKPKLQISFFDKYLTVWVALCMVTGILIGRFLPGIPAILAKFEYANGSRYPLPCSSG